MANSVYFMGQSSEEGRPQGLLTKNPDDGLSEAAMMNYRIARLKPNSPISAWTPWHDLVCSEPGVDPMTDWDYYYLYGTAGCISCRAVDVLAPYMDACFVPLPS